jgi:predicted short-subunit dehydrogenase-like oxidoreductase (DUF2520 family)
MKITLIGAGNLAMQLGLALKEAGLVFGQVYSRTEAAAKELANQLDCCFTTDAASIQAGADLYVCALKDDAVPAVLSQIRIGNGLLVHTAGSLPLSLLATYSSHYGVFYPLQTFSKSRKVDFQQVPIFIEASDVSTLGQLRNLASLLSPIVEEADSVQRLQLHLSAVFACNFVNLMYGISDDLLREQRLDFKHLLPLIRETAAKVEALTPAQAQTGPAVRLDRTVMNKHLTQLKNYPDWQDLYELLSNQIYQRANY